MTNNVVSVCTICLSTGSYLMQKDGYNIHMCTSCGLVFVHPQPTVGFLEDEVYSFKSGYQANKKGNYLDLPKDKKTLNIFDILHELGKTGNLLDVGCSSGEFMHFAELEDFVAFGVELNGRTATVAKEHGLNVFNGYLEDARYEDEFFDVIFLGDIIEHVPSPRALIEECTRILKKDGVLIISTPNLDCIWSKITFKLYNIFGIPWSSVTPPHHLYQFSSGNLYRLLMGYGYSLSTRFFLRPPRLMYELGSLHLLKKYKNTKSFRDMLFMIFAYILYTICYIVDIVLTPLKSRDFSMVMVFTKK